MPPVGSPIIDTEQKRKAILRTCSYRRRDAERTLIYLDADEKENLFARQQLPFNPLAPAKLGMLDRLPTELLCEVLEQLDLASLAAFRRASRRAREVPTRTPKIARLMAHALPQLAVLLRTGLAGRFTISTLHERLVGHPTCLQCGRMGSYVFLPTLSRCCLPCLRNSAAFAVVTMATVARPAALVDLRPIEVRRCLRGMVLHTLPGTYSLDTYGQRWRPRVLVARVHAREMLRRVLGTSESRAGMFLPGRFGGPWHAHHRYMAAMAFPWYNRARDELEHGVSCIGCGLGALTHDQFLLHFDDCDEAREMWAESEPEVMATILKEARQDTETLEVVRVPEVPAVPELLGFPGFPGLLTRRISMPPG
ncbi:hypothetical protein Micbo1qcDRAFT_206270 [Microdochium bolleyi]|uniref:F-box domain-containing protein n=1 Tax=Microdochium bolleyi TaxID=196109 RepID=A0A136IWN6_9PEZI|nr:hypothetical protein Micbo1qcDRAFT_206270 [Microdochium bolleyi]